MRSKSLFIGIGIGILLAGVSAYILLRRPAATRAPAPGAHEAAETAPVVPIPQQLDDIVANFRKIIILTDNEDALDEALRGRVLTVGRMLFSQNQVRITQLSGELSAEFFGVSFL